MNHATPADAINVQRFLNENRFSAYQWMVFGICFLIVLLDGFDTAAIGYIAPSLMGQWGIAKPALAPVLSAALFGLAGGAVLAGPLADKLGRKSVLVAAVALMGAACLASAFSGDLTTLTVWRFITGLGLGAAMPNAVTLMSEYCPDARRAVITNTMFCGFPLGAAFGGFLAAWMIPHFGWRAVLVLGGVVPLVLAVVMVWTLPESARYMVARQYPADRLRRVLAHIADIPAGVQRFVMTEVTSATTAKSGAGVVMSRPYVVGTLMLWIAYFMGLVIFYGLVNWMPVLFKEAGVPQSQATVISALFSLGGVGAVFFGFLMDRFNANVIVGVGFALTAVSIWTIGQSVGSIATLMLAVFVAGVIMNTSQSSLPSLAAAFYPTQGRATGVSWMMAFGRFGGIAGSFLVAELARRKLGFDAVFLVMAVPAAIAAVALFIKQIVHPQDESRKIVFDEVPSH